MHTSILLSFLHTFFAFAASDFLQDYDELSFISASPSDQVDVDLTSDLFMEPIQEEDDNGLFFDQIDQDPFASSVSLDPDFLASQGSACLSDAEDLQMLGKREQGKTCTEDPPSDNPNQNPDDDLDKIPDADSTLPKLNFLRNDEVCPIRFVEDRPFPVCHDPKLGEILEHRGLPYLTYCTECTFSPLVANVPWVFFFNARRTSAKSFRFS